MRTCTATQLFRDTKLLDICDRLEHTQSLQKEFKLGFNAFTLVSEVFYRENFHSDVLAAFFDMRGEHGEGALFLHGFIKLLNLALLKRRASGLLFATTINEADFEDYQTDREQGRIDIGILDSKSRKAIIVENKIHNAPDQPHQIPNYVQETEAADYTVLAVVYLSIDGCKYPSKEGWSVEEKAAIEPRLIQLAAFTNGKTPDLLTHWVQPCLQTSTKEDARTLLSQYGRLLQHLGTNEMNYQCHRAVQNRPPVGTSKPASLR